jgi:hypothetical protein
MASRIFSAYINDSRSIIEHFCFPIFPDGKDFRHIISTDYCLILQSDINSKQNWFTANRTELNACKEKVISFSGIINALAFNYVHSNSDILHENYIKDFCVYFTLHCYTSVDINLHL